MLLLCLSLLLDCLRSICHLRATRALIVSAIFPQEKANGLVDTQAAYLGSVEHVEELLRGQPVHLEAVDT